MKRLILASILAFFSLTATAGQVCHGKFVNPITDVCWDCAFPIKLFGQKITNGDGEDYDSYNPSGIEKVICACNAGMGLTRTGVPVSFWEFTRQVDVTKTPYCLVGLNQELRLGINADMDGGASRTGETTKAVFRHMHWYINPLLGLLEVILDSKCLEPNVFDLAYITELDKTWIDEEVARLMSPEAYLFNNMVAQLACGADCVAASAGMMGISNMMFWCAGCNGALYPLSGWTSASYSGVQMSSLLTHRMIAKQHRMMTQRTAAGKDAMCGGGNLEITMDKRQYKFSMLYPVPQATPKENGVRVDLIAADGSSQYWNVDSGTAGSAGTGVPVPAGSYSGTAGGQDGYILGCCQPVGRTTALWGSGREIPFEGEDFSYGIFRKRDCCQ